jgi:WD40 repeat protein
MSGVGDSSYCEIEVCKLGATTADVRLPIQARATARFNDDASLLATSEGGLVRVWSLPDGKPMSSLGLRLFSAQMRFSHDNRYLAGQSDTQVWMTHVPTGDLSLMLDLPAKFQLLALSADGEVLVTGNLASGTLHWWETAAVHSLTGVHFPGVATGSSFSPDGRYFIASGKRVRGSDTDWFQVWDRATRSRIAELSTNDIDEEGEARSRATAKLDGYLQSGVPASDLDFVRRSIPPGSSFRFVDGGRLAISASGGSNSVRLWDLRKRAAVAVSVPLTFDSAPVLTTNGRYLVARGTTVVDLRSGDIVFKAEYPVLALARRGFAVTGEFGLARIWNISTQEIEGRIRFLDMPASITFSPDEKEIAIAAGSRVQIWSWRLDQLMSEACRLISDNGRAAPWAALTAEGAYRKVCSALKGSR